MSTHEGHAWPCVAWRAHKWAPCGAGLCFRAPCANMMTQIASNSTRMFGLTLGIIYTLCEGIARPRSGVPAQLQNEDMSFRPDQKHFKQSIGQSINVL